MGLNDAPYNNFIPQEPILLDAVPVGAPFQDLFIPGDTVSIYRVDYAAMVLTTSSVDISAFSCEMGMCPLGHEPFGQFLAAASWMSPEQVGRKDNKVCVQTSNPFYVTGGLLISTRSEPGGGSSSYSAVICISALYTGIL